MLWVGVCVGAMSLAATMLLDSWMWNRQLLWPEGDVLWFNTALNKSVEYGTMPVHWYLTSALPKALLAPALLVPVGAWFDRYAYAHPETRLVPSSKTIEHSRSATRARLRRPTADLYPSQLQDYRRCSLTTVALSTIHTKRRRSMQSRSRVPDRAPKHEHEHRPAAHGGAVTLSMHPVSLRWRRRVRDLLVAAAAFVALY
jgi:hypothetical protein